MRRTDVGGLLAFALSAAIIDPVAAYARELAAEQACFDALVSASIVRQTPTAFPERGDDRIVMSWPWIVELDVERVIRGTAPSGHLIVLTVQHTDFRTDLGARRWWLRRNTLGGFNVLRLGDRAHPPRCAEGTPPAVPYIRPADGETLRHLIDESDALYGEGR